MGNEHGGLGLFGDSVAVGKRDGELGGAVVFKRGGEVERSQLPGPVRTGVADTDANVGTEPPVDASSEEDAELGAGAAVDDSNEEPGDAER